MRTLGISPAIADPGPTSYCTITTSINDITTEEDGGVRPNVISRTAPTFTLVDVLPGSSVHVIDIQGRIIHSVSTSDASPLVITLPTHVPAGRYTIRITHPLGQKILPLLIMM